MIAEKEMANMELRDKIDQSKEKYNSEINKLMQQVQDYRSKCLDLNENKNDKVSYS